MFKTLIVGNTSLLYQNFSLPELFISRHQLYNALPVGGRLIICHACCDHIFGLFWDKMKSYDTVAYLSKFQFDNMMQSIGPYQQDHYLSKSFFPAPFDKVAAKHFLMQFFALDNEQLLNDFSVEISEFMQFYEEEGEQVSLTFHTDMYILDKPAS